MSIFRSIKARLLIFGFCISLIPISIITTIYYLNARSTLKKQILQDFKAIAQSKKTHIISFIQSKRGRTIDFSSDGFIRDSLEKINNGDIEKDKTVNALNKHLLVNKIPIDSYLIAIAIVNLDGKVVASTSEKWIEENISDQEIFSQVVGKNSGETHVNPLADCPYIDKKCIDISTPIISVNGIEKIGVIVNCYDLDSLNEITTNRIGRGKTGEVYLVNKDKMMITDSRFIADAPFNQVVDTEPIRKIIESGEEMTGIYQDYRGVQIVGASINIPEYDWILLTEMNEAEAFASLRGLGIIALIVGGVCGVAAISVGIIFSISTARPINRLKFATEKIADGNLKHRVDIDRRDEIGSLAKSFNIMAGELMKKTKLF